jgi:hypothetical protein
MGRAYVNLTGYSSVVQWMSWLVDREWFSLLVVGGYPG